MRPFDDLDEVISGVGFRWTFEGAVFLLEGQGNRATKKANSTLRVQFGAAQMSIQLHQVLGSSRCI